MCQNRLIRTGRRMLPGRFLVARIAIRGEMPFDLQPAVLGRIDLHSRPDQEVRTLSDSHRTNDDVRVAGRGPVVVLRDRAVVIGRARGSRDDAEEPSGGQ